VHADTQRAPAALACVTRNAQFTFQTILRLIPSGMHSLPIKLFKIDTIQGARRYAERACGACLCHKNTQFTFQTILRIDTFGDA
jgi:hypothetical protein